MSEQQFTYIGGELELFSGATNWKAYIAATLKPYLGTKVLEVGAGIGATTQMLCAGSYRRWMALEPDPQLAAQIRQKIAFGQIPRICEVREGTLESLNPKDVFDAVLYIDVLEHIEHDFDELARAASHLAPGGHLVVLAPAHQALFTEFDKAIGHYRRYNRGDLQKLAPAHLLCVKAIYLDAIGLAASLCNKLILKSAQPTCDQILLWDRIMVRLSRLLDPLFAGNIGKSVIVIWQKPP